MSADLLKDTLPVIPGAFVVQGGTPFLMGTKCSRCGAAFFPPRHICPHCLTDEGVERVRLGNSGRLYVSTTIYVSGKEFKPPYLFGYVILEPEEIRIPTLITGVEDPTMLKPGARMEMVIEKLRDDDEKAEIVTYKFRPVAR